MTGGKLWLRVSGVVVIVICLLYYTPGAPGFFQTLALPIIMAAGTWCVVQNTVAVAFGAMVLAAIHSDLGAENWTERFAYPGLALLSGSVLATMILLRFRQRIARTHEARWRGRGFDRNP